MTTRDSGRSDAAGAPNPEPSEKKRPPLWEGLTVRMRSSEFRSLLWLFLVPWFVLSLVVLVLPGMSGSTLWSGVGKVAVLLVAAVAILFYEQWFIDVTRAGVGESPYTFSSAEFLIRCGDDKDEQFKRLTQVVDKLQTRIGEEYTDIASRTGWLVAGQAFLLAAFVTVLNADRLTATSRQWLSVGIGLAGAAISFVLALSIFYGTALVEALKDPRDAAERVADEEFKVPKTGVAKEKEAHTYGHFATRYIPCLAYISWVALALLAIFRAFSPTAPSGMTLMFPAAGSATAGATTSGPTTSGTPTSGTATSGRGWKELEASPWFARGADTYDKAVDDCPKPSDKTREADKWLGKVVDEWENRASASKGDVVILVGGADRIRLGAALARQYDTNMGLARNRAELIKNRLIKATADQPEANKLTSERIVVLVTGPQYSPTAEKPAAGQTEKCEEFADDRRVQVWLPSGS
jgi:hypothetical protein